MSIDEYYQRIIEGSTDIISALQIVDHQFQNVLSENTTEEERRQFFYGVTDDLNPTKNCQDLLRFWNALEPYVWSGEKGSLDKYWIIQVLREMNSTWQVYQLNREIDRRGKEQMEEFNKLLEHIEDLPRKLYLIMNNHQRKQTFYSLKYFDEQYYHPYRDYIIRHIIKGAGEEPITVVGSDGNNQLSIYAREYYIHSDLKWEETGKAVQTVEYSDDEKLTARRRGLMTGYTLNDL